MGSTFACKSYVTFKQETNESTQSQLEHNKTPNTHKILWFGH